MTVVSQSREIGVLTEPKPRLGQLLVASGDMTREMLDKALALQIGTRSRARLGAVLLANDLVTGDALLKALSRQSGIGRIDLDIAPPDPDLLATADPFICLRAGFLPWRKVGQVTILAISDPANARLARASCHDSIGDVAFALTGEAEIRKHILQSFQDILARHASYLCPESYSCRALQSRWTLPKLIVLAIFALWLAASFPAAIFTALLLFLTAANLGTAMLRLLAFGTMMLPRAHITAPKTGLAAHRALPVISVLVPLFRESRVLDGLLNALNRLDYPRTHLDVKLILEADDDETATHLRSCALPNWIEVVEVPVGRIRTKPRAMNYALPLCKGTIIGIYDAEDRPEPDQLRKVAHALGQAPRNIACVQGRLDFYNTGQNWLTRCFAIEYAQWFRVLLPGLHRLGAPIPLGGTSVFFRRAILEKLGGWDAHNVTEDADLGMRLARRGYRCGILDSTTYEEATSASRAWMRQRSRWLKGYALTWASHMRHPLLLIDDLGLGGWLTFQALFLGTLAGYLAFPLHLLLWAGIAGMPLPFTALVPQTVWFWFVTSHLIGLAGLALVAARALFPRSHRHLLPIVLTMPFYWPLGALASWRALAESFFAPFYWAKTEHGLDQVASPDIEYRRTP